MIRKTSGGYKVVSEKGKNLGGPYKTRAQAEKRLRQVEFFKHRIGIKRHGRRQRLAGNFLQAAPCRS